MMHSREPLPPARARFVLGVDVGSTTVKAVLVHSSTNAVVWKDYQRHETHQAGKVLEFLQRIEREATPGADSTEIFFTGSGGSRLASLAGARFVQEVTAVSLQVERTHPQVLSVIELGGQDAKMILFRDQGDNRPRKKITSMNDKCAGGTGAVLDKLSAKLNIPAHTLCRQRHQGLRIHPVAGKCGVFAETDINGLQKQGIPADELMASLFEAIVLQNLSVLTRGNTLLPCVLLLGGPNTFIQGMQEAWRAHIPKMWEERKVRWPEGKDLNELIFAPESAQYFAALGAVAFGLEECETASPFKGAEAFERALHRNLSGAQQRGGLPALCSSIQEQRWFVNAYRPPTPPEPRFEPGEPVNAWLGIDGGSTSTKAVLIDAEGTVLRRAYQLSRGNPIADAIALIGSLRTAVESFGAHLVVEGLGVTGYAREVLQSLFGADVAVVETVAHARSAIRYVEFPDVIIDVGGQDIKLMVLKDGHVKDFMLNTQCSAGNGYFLQATAESLGLRVEDYAERAFEARQMPAFGYGCAVFLQADIVNFQRQGWQADEILAGLASVLPKNIWLYVAKIPNLSSLGHTFVLQGGTQRNMAAVKAQVDYIRSRFPKDAPPRVVVHPYCGEAGAIGAALEAMEATRQGGPSQFIGLDAAAAIRYETDTSERTRCTYCKNSCLRTFIDYEIPTRDAGCGPSEPEAGVSAIRQRLILANCERGAAENLEDLKLIQSSLQEVRSQNPNLVDFAAREVWRTRGVTALPRPPLPRWKRWRRASSVATKPREDLRIGIPRALNLYATAPFFRSWFEALGLQPSNIIFSDFTTDALYRAGATRGAIDPCFPSKVTLAHVHNLLTVHHTRQPLDAIFLPMFEAVATPLLYTIGQHACPTVMATPETVKAAYRNEVDEFARRGIRYINPLVHMVDEDLLARQLWQAWHPLLGVTEQESAQAVEVAHAAQEAFQQDLRRRARKALDALERESRLGIVLLARPYHHDPGLSHGIAGEFQKRGFPVFSQFTLPLDEDLLARLFAPDLAGGHIQHSLDIRDVWKHAYSSSTNMKIWAAKFTARHPNLIGVELSNFRCGHDAPTYRLIENILEHAGKPYFSFKDLDENKATGSMKIRFDTIHYFLSKHRERLIRGPLPLAERKAGMEEATRTATAGV
ncbi:MAG: CoA activase [Bryobacterales bacterium]|nr:CoA activase [Bryobacterales bacterium]